MNEYERKNADPRVVTPQEAYQAALEVQCEILEKRKQSAQLCAELFETVDEEFKE